MRNDRAVGALLLAYVASQALDSPIRWVLSSVGAAPLIYLRDAALMLVIALSVHADFEQRRHCLPKIALFAMFVSLGCVALLNGLPAGQMLFGFKVWLPFLAIFCAIDSGLLRIDGWQKPAVLLLVVTLIGLVANYYWRPPWVGMTLEVAGADVVGNREWTTYGVRRLSGFARSSYDAAMLLLLLSVYLFAVSRSLARTFVVAMVSGIGIALTTSKGALGTFMVLVALIPTVSRTFGLQGLLAPLTRGFILLFALVGAIAPFWSAISVQPEFQAGTLAQKILASMVSRGWETWPSAFALLGDEFQQVVGRGLGGIGVAQNYFEASIANPADNFVVYLYVIVGVLGTAFYLTLVSVGLRGDMKTVAGRLCGFGVVAVLCYGVTASIIENALFAMALGLLTRGAFSSGRTRSIEPIASPSITTSRSRSSVGI